MTQSISIKDANGAGLGIPPIDVVTITADTEITAYKALTPSVDVSIYFEGGDETTYTLAAGTTILIHSTLRLSTNTVCLVY